MLNDDYVQFDTNISYSGSLKPSDNHIILKSKYDGYGTEIKKFNVDYLISLQQSNTIPNSLVDFVFAHNDQYVTYAEIDDDTTQTSCTLTDLRGVEISDDGADGIIFIDSEINDSRYYVDCYVDDQKVYSDIFKTEKNLKTTIVIFDSIFGNFAGVDIGVMFVIFVASVFTKRNAYIGLFVVGATTAIMSALQVITLTPEWFGLIVVLMILGILTGRKTRL